MKDEWTVAVWREACAKTGVDVNLDSFIQSELASPIPTRTVHIIYLYLQFSEDSIKPFIDMKKRIMSDVEDYYDFDASHLPTWVSRNASLARALLSRMSFVYFVCLSSLLFTTHIH